jgi:peptidoglycan/xylan/chitin deacetylase (PgdA/CDA1 family)
LLYHRVNRSPKARFSPLRDLSVRTDDFDKHLAFLKAHFAVISLSELVECLRHNKILPANFAVLTFDDGYEDNYTDAFPLLVKHGVPATLFITAGLIEGLEPLWNDWLELVLLQAERPYLLLGDGAGIRLPLRTTGEKWYAFEWLSECLLPLTPSARVKMLQEVGWSLGVPSTPPTGSNRRLLSWVQMREMQGSGIVDIGSHSMRHALMVGLDPALLEEEIGASRRLIMRRLGNDCLHFAYPNGRLCDFDETAVGRLRTDGYLSACTGEPGLLTRKTDLYRIPRIDTVGMSVEGLAMRLAAVIERYLPEATAKNEGWENRAR